MRSDARHRVPLAHRLARAPDVERLQVSQPAVNRAQVIERRAAPEVVAFDERHAEAALRRVLRDREPVDPAADDEHVEGAVLQAVEIAAHHERSYAL